MPVPNADISVAVLPLGARPGLGDWTAATAHPSGNGGIGVLLTAVARAGQFGVWVRVSDNPETVVLDPTEVGYVVHT